MEVVLTKSKKKDKKYDAVIDGKKTISFGQAGASDDTKHKDVEIKDIYITRHKNPENWNDPKTAGFYAKNILWNKPSIRASIEDTNKRYKNIHIKLKG
jgi:ABC-type Zn uptake system ZnuABC Zn-binding protein ZnuA